MALSMKLKWMFSWMAPLPSGPCSSIPGRRRHPLILCTQCWNMPLLSHGIVVNHVVVTGSNLFTIDREEPSRQWLRPLRSQPCPL